jgi:hypothetical protein
MQGGRQTFCTAFAGVAGIKSEYLAGIELRLENAWCFFAPSDFPTTSARRHLEKSRREKSCARVRGFVDFYQRFFR